MTDFNVIETPWIAVRRADGTRDRTAPFEITEGLGDGDVSPPVELDFSRPDFDGAAIQLLIGLLQTAHPPDRTSQWYRGALEPPSPRQLHRSLEAIAPAFDLFGARPRFMQAYEAFDPSATGRPVTQLMLNTPTGRNRAHFVKPRDEQRLCPACTTCALFTLQTNATRGGRGYRTSVRGGGPLTTVCKGESLWHTVWLNVLNERDFEVDGGPDSLLDASVFPWWGETRTGDDGETTSEDVSSYQLYWALPRRVWLEADSIAEGTCGVCGRYDEHTIASYRRTNQGIDYAGPWQHPLTLYTFDDNTPDRPEKGRGRLTYRNWLGAAVSDPDRSMQPAKTVACLTETRGDDLPDSIAEQRKRPQGVSRTRGDEPATQRFFRPRRLCFPHTRG